MKASALLGAARTALRHGPRLAAAVGLATVLAAGPAQALSIVVPIGFNVNDGGHYSGHFNISSHLVGYQVVSASVTAFGDSTLLSGPQIVHDGWRLISTQDAIEVICVPFAGCVDVVVGTDRYYESYTDLIFGSGRDRMTVDVGEGSGSASTLYTSSNGEYVQWSGPFTERRNSFGGTDFLTWYRREVIEGYVGPLSAVVALSLNDLADLNRHGLMRYSVAAPEGTFRLTQVRLDFELAPAPVPEPAAWAVMILGFGGVGTLMRRTRRLAAA